MSVWGFVAAENNTRGPEQTECHNGTVTDNQEDTQTRLPNPQQREHNSRENKRTERFFCFLFWESCPGSSPSQQSWDLLVQGFPHCHGYNNTRPIRLTGPVTPRHAKTHRNRPQTGFGLHTGTLTLTPDFPRLTITLGAGGLLLEITLATMTQRATTTPPAPFFPRHARTVYSSASLSWDKLDPLNGSSSKGF